MKKENKSIGSEFWELEYSRFLAEAAQEGIFRMDRTGVGRRSIFNVNMKLDVSAGFPILSGRRMYPKTTNTEFNWIWQGETNIQRFKDAGVKIWDSWADENGELGPVYGSQLRNWNGENIDQINSIVHEIKENPASSRLCMNMWNVSKLEDMALPPCYPFLQFFVEDEKLSLSVTQRSGDLFLGIPYDFMLFTQLLAAVADLTDKTASMLYINIGDAHVYENQIEAIQDYISQPCVTQNVPYSLFYNNISNCYDLKLGEYHKGKRITAPVAV